MKSMYARNPSTELPDFISADGDILITDSLRVAQVHKKRHDNVMQLIRKRVAEAGSWGLPNFKEAHYIDAQNSQQYEMFTMTRRLSVPGRKNDGKSCRASDRVHRSIQSDGGIHPEPA
jgi:hypothetical protein